ncbi:hypothetical protein CC1G_06053 [Coprinopsis cinerea okayama7|uniref:Uncharacterized protein n=1 Tax=Coprinopsis cinerea (strain Okayama-7 / 130 / ATCC MYA-4618 / FGSC 9003) TaxID=240176 RepID=A8N4H6_COPC7|nr:hypothetical protein CC1G_06053 [Coprinopsis cinerea okayama7\|eukprot:XP_001829844.2 hypothetical protein CC1G_06053 [Coprinopsis cinerea okayama7\
MLRLGNSGSNLPPSPDNSSSKKRDEYVNDAASSADLEELQKHIERAKSAFQSFLKNIGKDGVRYAQSMSHQVLALLRNGEGCRHIRDYLCRQTAKFQPWRHTIKSSKDEILQFRGVEDILRKIDGYLEEIDRVQGWIDDMETYLFSDAQEFVHAFNTNQLEFQQ